MEKQYLYFLSMAVLFFASVILLAAAQENLIGAYASAFATWYFLCSLMSKPRRPSFDFPGLTILVIWALLTTSYVIQMI
jgi:hypothetical protein